MGRHTSLKHLLLIPVVALMLACGSGGGSDGDSNGGGNGNNGGGTANGPCLSSSDCLAGEVCVGEADNATSTFNQICRNVTGASENGATCAIDADCQSNLCGQSLDGVNRCLGPCDVASQSGCSAGTSCYANVVFEQFSLGPPGREGDEFDAYDSCRSNIGSYDVCSKDSDCIAGESCAQAFNKDHTASIGRCITNIGAQPAGGPCFVNADCQVGQCLTGLSNECYGACSNTLDCAAPTTCTVSLTVDNLGTMSVLDDIVINSCESP